MSWRSNLNVGLLYFVAFSGLAAMGALMAGWSSNNKYALLGGFRVVAQLLSYEIPLDFYPAGGGAAGRHHEYQRAGRAQGRTLLRLHSRLVRPADALCRFVIFFVAALAEGERAPFDLLEAESEIVAGFNIEYSGMKFAWFFLQFFVNSLILAALAVTIFLGGWQGPFVEQFPVLGIVYFSIKTLLVLFVLCGCGPPIHACASTR